MSAPRPYFFFFFKTLLSNSQKLTLYLQIQNPTRMPRLLQYDTKTGVKATPSENKTGLDL